MKKLKTVIIVAVMLVCGVAWAGEGVFDYNSAKKAGHTDQDIAKYLSNEFQPNAAGRFVLLKERWGTLSTCLIHRLVDYGGLYIVTTLFLKES